MIKYFAVIVAGGSGTRMNNSLPKQFLLLNGTPVIMHTIAAFFTCPQQPEIIVVLNRQHFEIWKALCIEHNFNIPHFLIAGGDTRFGSVKNALSSVNQPSVIAIHDAVRPLISADIITEAYEKALIDGNAVVAVKSKDSIRMQTADGHSRSIDRNEIFLVQTPQTFQSEILKKAYEQPFQEIFTDDASVVENSGISINLIMGNPNNFKITFPNDLLVAELILNEKSRN